MTERETEVFYTSMCGDVITWNSYLNFKHLAMKCCTPNRLHHLPSKGTWFTKCCQLFKVFLSQLSGVRIKNFMDISLQIWGSFSWNFTGQCGDTAYFIRLIVGNPQKSVTLQAKASSSSHSVLWIFACAGTPLCLLCSSLCSVASIIPWY